MKISIKTDPETLFLLHKIVLEQLQIYPINRATKTAKSVFTELFGQLNQRCFNYSANPNGKKITLTLKYHLADYLLDTLENLKFSYGGIYESNKIDMFRNELHQKLL